MGRTITPKISWLLTLFCIGYFPTFGMFSVQNTKIDRTYTLEKLRGNFIEILETQPKFIYLNSTESQYNATNGTYKLFPYYQKISPEPLALEDSRFIIQKHVITGQWQLTEVYDYYWSKNIKAFPVTEENENSALLHNQFIKSTCTHSHTIDELKKQIFNVNMEVEANNQFITSSTEQNEILMALVDKQRKELANQTKIVKEFESILIQKENEICDLGNKMQSILSVNKKEISNLSKIHNTKLIEKQNEICNISKTQTKLESNLIEKENEIRDIFKTENKLQSTLLEKQNEIRILETQIQKCKKITNTNQNKIKSMQAENRSISDLKKEIENSEKNFKLLEKEKQMSNQELSKYQTLYAKLECESVTWKNKENVLNDMMNDDKTIINQLTEKLQKLDKIMLKMNDMMNDDKTIIKQLTEKLQKLDKIMFKTSPKKLKNSEIKENGHKNNSQIEDNEKFMNAENHASINNLENATDSNQNDEMEAKEKLQKCETTMKKNHESLKLENHENKKTLTNEDNSQANPVTIKSETDETQVNLKINTISLNNDKKTTKEKLTKYEAEINLKALEFAIDHLERVPETQTLKVKSKEEKQMKRKNDKNKIKILNAIEQILLKSMPTVNEKRSAFYNGLVAVRKREQETEISKFLQQLRKSEDGDLMLKIKSYLENQETLIEETDPKYQYESLFMNIGVMNYAQYMITNCMPIDSNCIDDYGIFRNFVAEMQNLYKKHEKILDDMLESVKDEKLKIKVECFRKKECLFNSQKYEYEKCFRTIGYIVYGYGNNVQEESIQLENQKLKVETILLESVESVVCEKKENVGNQTNVETKFLEGPPMDLYVNLIKSKQIELEENEAKMVKQKEKMPIKEQQILDIIEGSLYMSGLSPFKKMSSQFNEILAATKRSEYKSLVSKLLQDLINTKDPQMTSNIAYFLETKDFLSAHILFEYEFILMHHGAMIYNHDLLMKLEPMLKGDFFSKLSLPEDKKNEFKKNYPAMQKLYKHHEKIVNDRLQVVKDEKMKLKIKGFQEKRCLYDLPQNKYEYFIKTIGSIVYGCGGHLEGL